MTSELLGVIRKFYSKRMAHLSSMLQFILLHFCIKFVVGFGSTWELYQLFTSKHENSSVLHQFHNSTDSKIPLVFTFKPGKKIGSLTTGKGRVLFIGKKNEEIPRFTSPNLTPNTSELTPKNDTLKEITETNVNSGSETGGEFLVSTITKLILQFISVDDAIEYMNWLRSALINYFGSKFLGPLKESTSISTGRDGWGGIAFPSLEGALLSLAFLTFAVFLIDLIQNLLANLRVPTTTTAPDTGGMDMIEIPVRGRKQKTRESSWMSALTNSALAAIERTM